METNLTNSTKMTRKQKIAAGLTKPPKKSKSVKESYRLKRLETCKVTLSDERSSPRKMRMLADVIRGKKLSDALNFLALSPRHAATPLRKLLLNGYHSYNEKFEQLEQDELLVELVTVDGGQMLKRLRPAPQGRGYRIRKRSNHVTVILKKIIEQN